MRTSNPTLNQNVFRNARTHDYSESNVMTVQGTVIKTGIALLLLIASAGFVFNRFQVAGGVLNPGAAFAAVSPLMFGGMIVGFITMLITVFKPTTSPYTTPVYAIAEGLLIGGISAFADSRFGKPIAFQAACLTFGTLFMMLFAYQSGLIRVTDKLRSGIMAATGAVFLLYLATFVLGFFGIAVPFIHSSGLIGIGFSLFVVGLAAFNLLLDFDLIENGAAAGAPKYMEWYGAFALLVTLIWLYIEIVRLLSKLNSRD